jgi:hypothetical protein
MIKQPLPTNIWSSLDIPEAFVLQGHEAFEDVFASV